MCTTISQPLRQRSAPGQYIAHRETRKPKNRNRVTRASLVSLAPHQCRYPEYLAGSSLLS